VATDGAGDSSASQPGPGSALRFSNNDYVKVGALAIPSDFTLEAWVLPVSFSGERCVVAKDRANQDEGQFRLGLDSTGHAFFLMSDAGGSDHGLFASDYTLQSPTALPVNAWSHVAVVKTGAQFALYVNGAVVVSATASSAFVHGGPAVDFRIGARVAADGTGVDGGFDGTIDEVRLWKVARSAAQIAAARSIVILPSDPVSADLAAYYRFDEGAGTTTADARGGLLGTLVSSPTWVASTAF
jgi:hypothetical protein